MIFIFRHYIFFFGRTLKKILFSKFVFKNKLHGKNCSLCSYITCRQFNIVDFRERFVFYFKAKFSIKQQNKKILLSTSQLHLLVLSNHHIDG